MFSYGPLHRDDQQDLIYNSLVQTQDVAWKSCRKRWTIETNGERVLGKSMLAARNDDNDDDGVYSKRILIPPPGQGNLKSEAERPQKLKKTQPFPWHDDKCIFRMNYTRMDDINDINPTPPHEQDATQGQYFEWSSAGFISLTPVEIPRLKSPVCPIIYP